jgi:hypothetical protein
MQTLYEGFRRFFPDLKPTHYDDDGNAFFEVKEVAECLGMTTEEVIDALPEGSPFLAPSNKLNRLH